MAAFDKSKPAGATKLRLSDEEIRSNWDGLEDAIGRDHKFPSGYGVDAGEHSKISFNAPIATPTDAANKCFVYPKDVGGKVELHFLDEDGNEIQLTSAGAVRAFPAGTEMVFIQASAPTGWTRNAARQDNAMLCYAASGAPGSGGSANPQSTHTHTGPSHAHDMSSHTHTGPSHTHTGPSHTHTGPSHTHQIENFGQRDDGTALSLDQNSISDGDAFTATAAITIGANPGAAAHNFVTTAGGTGATGAGGTGATGAGGTGATGGPSAANTGAGGTGATGANTAPYFIETISATKD